MAKIIVPNTIRNYEDMIIETSMANDFSFPTWNTNHVYYQGNMAYYNNRLYRSLEFNTDKQPDLYTDDFWFDFGEWDNTTGNPWDSGTTYSNGDLVTYKVGYKNYIYQSQADSNTGVRPTSDETKWLNIGAINLWRCLYGATENKTEHEGDFSITFNTNKADFVYLIGVNAKKAKIEIFDDNDTLLQTEEEDLQYKNAASWKDYWFKDFNFRNTYGIYTNIGFRYKAKITLESETIARLGNIIIGKSFDIGQLLWNPSVGILDFSKLERDASFGDVDLKQGSFAKRADIVVKVDTARSDAIETFLTAIRGTEVLILADERIDGFDSLKIRGFVRDHDVALQGPNKSEITIQVRGLI